MRPTNSGPLMANFHCPNCGHTETLYANAKNCKCPICNKKLVKGDAFREKTIPGGTFKKEPPIYDRW